MVTQRTLMRDGRSNAKECSAAGNGRYIENVPQYPSSNMQVTVAHWQLTTKAEAPSGAGACR